MIDDNQDIREALSELIESWNCIPFLATSEKDYECLSRSITINLSDGGARDHPLGPQPQVL